MSRIKVENYGQMLATINDLAPVTYEEFGSYQGDYVAINADDKRFFAYVGSFGSCSGCDWLEAERDWNDDTVGYKEAVEYCGDLPPKLILPKRKYSEQEWFSFVSLFMDDYYAAEYGDQFQELTEVVDAYLSREEGEAKQ